MRIRTFFFIALAVPTLACFAGGSWIVGDLWQAYDGNGQARDETVALAALAKTMEVYAIQRGNMNVSMLSEQPVAPAMRSAMEQERQATTVAVEDALGLTRRLRTAEGAAASATVGEMGKRMKDLDQAVAGAVERPKSERDPVLVKEYAGRMEAIIAAATPVMDRLEKHIATLSGEAGDMVGIARMGMDFRSLAGNRSINVVSTLVSGRPASAETLNTIAELKGSMNLAWKRIVFMLDQAGRPPAVMEALQKVEERFRTGTDRLYAPVLVAARGTGEYGIDIPAFRRQNIANLAEIGAIRDAAFGEAVRRAEAARQQAGIRLAVVVVALGACLAIGLMLGLLFGRRVVNALIGLTGTVTQLAEGNHDVTVGQQHRKDELGRLADAIEVLRRNALAAAELAAASEAEHRSRAERAERLDRLCATFGDDSDRLIKAMGAAAAEAIEQSQGRQQVAREVLGSTDRAARSSDEASTSVQTVAAATEELSSSISEISTRVSNAANVSVKAMQETEEASRRIAGLAEAASRIDAVVGLINDVAGQTNLLALNATIEAARAGEAGKGFAVVAGEVKALAGQTAKATTEISGQIGTIQSMTKEAVACIEHVAATIQSLNEMSVAVAAAVEEQGAATSEIARNVQVAAAGTRQASEAVVGVGGLVGKAESASQAMVEAMKGLEQRAGELTGSIGGFLKQVRS